jgi:hypothetical protein
VIDALDMSTMMEGWREETKASGKTHSSLISHSVTQWTTDGGNLCDTSCKHPLNDPTPSSLDSSAKGGHRGQVGSLYLICT